METPVPSMPLPWEKFVKNKRNVDGRSSNKMTDRITSEDQRIRALESERAQSRDIPTITAQRALRGDRYFSPIEGIRPLRRHRR